MQPRHYDSYLPSSTYTWSVPRLDSPATFKGFADSVNVTYAGSKKDDDSLLDPAKDLWGMTPGRAEYHTIYYSSTFTARGLHTPADMSQTVGVYLKPEGGGAWNLYQEVNVTSYGFADKPFEVTLRTNESFQVMLKAGSKPSDVTVWQVSQTSWNGQDLDGIDGLLHITDMSWGRVKHPSDVVAVGHEEIEVMHAGELLLENHGLLHPEEIARDVKLGDDRSVDSVGAELDLAACIGEKSHGGYLERLLAEVDPIVADPARLLLLSGVPEDGLPAVEWI